MSFAIMRCKKIASMGSVAASLQHCHRERETHNADTHKTADNQHFSAQSTDEAMGKLRDLLPDKRRKDAVLAIEYVMTASPEWWNRACEREQAEFFKQSRAWLAEKYGEDRIITATVHRDETSPHLSAFVVPLTEDGRLSAKEFIGSRTQMSQDQTTFAKAVKHLGLERGLENSKASHTSIQSYYSRVNNPIHNVSSIDVLEPSVKDWFNPKSYGDRVAKSVIQQITPTWESLRAKAIEFDAFGGQKKALEARERVLEGVEMVLEQLNSLKGDYADLKNENRSLLANKQTVEQDLAFSQNEVLLWKQHAEAEKQTKQKILAEVFRRAPLAVMEAIPALMPALQTLAAAVKREPAPEAAQERVQEVREQIAGCLERGETPSIEPERSVRREDDFEL